MKYIKLTKGKKTIVDDVDFEYLNQWKWHCSSEGYALRRAKKSGKNQFIRMHRLINETPIGKDTDHINHDRLDNRRENLRTVTRQMNNFNRKPELQQGVCFHKKANKWMARIKLNGKEKYLGLFDNIDDALLARKNAEKELNICV